MRKLLDRLFAKADDVHLDQSQDNASSLQGVNSYHRQLTDDELNRNEHRDFVGGLWDEIGRLQHDFMVSRGLTPQHTLLDVGCGALRGGIHFIDSLDLGNYHGLDINESLLNGGKREIKHAGLVDKHPKLLINQNFEFWQFGTKFDYALAVSVFTHLPMNHIVRCLVELAKVLKPQGQFFASFFEAPTSAFLEQIKHEPGGVITHYDEDPFHYSFAEFQCMADLANLSVELVGNWSHPRDQQMLCFRLTH